MEDSQLETPVPPEGSNSAATDISKTPAFSSPKSLMVIGGFIVIFIVGVGGIFSGREFFLLKTLQNPSVVPMPTVGIPSSVPTTDPTTGWETYINSQYHYSFRYPADVFLEEVKGPDWYDAGIQLTNEKGKGFIDLSRTTGMQIIVNAQKMSTMADVSKNDLQQLLSLPIGGSEGYTSKLEETEMGQFKWSVFFDDINLNEIPQRYKVHAMLLQQDFLYSFDLEGYDKQFVLENKELLKQIFSTFRFVVD